MTFPTQTAARLAGTAAAWVRDLLIGPDRIATVVHAGPHAVYVDLDGQCIGVLAGATAVPCGIRTLEPRLGPLVGVGDRAYVGSGRLRLGPLEVRVGRVVNNVVPPLTSRTARWASDHLQAPALDLPAGALTRLGAGDPACVPALLGLGGGLTPLGDDVLAGWLAGMVAASHPGRLAIANQVTRLAPTRTTILSATLLRCAVRGEVLPEYADLVGALGRHDHLVALEQLVAVGHTSGRGMAHGLALALPEISRRPLVTRRTG